jgi:hypothetical protein
MLLLGYVASFQINTLLSAEVPKPRDLSFFYAMQLRLLTTALRSQMIIEPPFIWHIYQGSG